MYGIRLQDGSLPMKIIANMLVPKRVYQFSMTLLYIAVLLVVCACQRPAESEKALLAAMQARELPQWYDDAKLGIFIHWGPFTVPAFAPTDLDINDIFTSHYDDALIYTPYTEWYWNALQYPDSATFEYHRTHYGEDFPYQNFGELFKQAIHNWNPDVWAEQFAAAGAKYVVLTTKHHDGFLMWPSKYTNPNLDNWYSERDLVAELAAAVRARGMRFGLYYSGGFDWAWNTEGFGRTITELMSGTPIDSGYANYIDSHFRELIERYEPAVLWNDICYPGGKTLWPMIADYYNQVPDGVINDRYADANLPVWILRNESLRRIADNVLKMLLRSNGGDMTALLGGDIQPHYDYQSKEYLEADRILTEKWEATRGIGHSFGYNRAEPESNLLSERELIEGFIDTVAKNGNLLLNVAVKANGEIPLSQVTRLDALGEWLHVNGEAIYGTRPWIRASGETADGEEVRFTTKQGALFAIVFADRTVTGDIRIRDLGMEDITGITLLSYGEVSWSADGDELLISVPADASVTPPMTFSISRTNH